MNLYEAIFQDAAGRSFPSKLRTESDTAAKTIANAMALKSDAKWIELRKIVKIALPMSVDVEGVPTPITPNHGQAAESTSDVQRKGRLYWEAATANDKILVEVCSVKADYLKPGQNTETTTTDPLDSTGRSYLMTENGAAASSFRGGKLRRKIRKN